MNRTVAFIQARTSSQRFPRKVLQDLAGVPMIIFMARRAARATLVDEVVVVTSTDPTDDELAEAVRGAGVALFRGDLDDVLRRFVDAAAAHNADEVIRLTGDCPLVDPAVVDAVIRCRRQANADYASNVDPPTFPDGLDVECFSRHALERAHLAASRPSEREHVTLWMRSDGAALQRANLRAPADLSGIRLTVDYPDDLAVVRALVEKLGGAPGFEVVRGVPHDARPAPRVFDLYDVLRVLSQAPALSGLNAHARNEGLAKSLAEEES